MTVDVEDATQKTDILIARDGKRGMRTLFTDADLPKVFSEKYSNR